MPSVFHKLGGAGALTALGLGGGLISALPGAVAGGAAAGNSTRANTSPQARGALGGAIGGGAGLAAAAALAGKMNSIAGKAALILGLPAVGALGGGALAGRTAHKPSIRERLFG